MRLRAGDDFLPKSSVTLFFSEMVFVGLSFRKQSVVRFGGLPKEISFDSPLRVLMCHKEESVEGSSYKAATAHVMMDT